MWCAFLVLAVSKSEWKPFGFCWGPFLIMQMYKRRNNDKTNFLKWKPLNFIYVQRNLLRMSFNSVAHSFSSMAFSKNCLLEKQLSHWGEELGLFQAYYFTVSCQWETQGGGWGLTVARQTIKLVLNTFPYEGSHLLPKNPWAGGLVSMQVLLGWG